MRLFAMKKINELSTAFNYHGIIVQREFFITVTIECKLVQFVNTYSIMFKCTINGIKVSDIVLAKPAFNVACYGDELFVILRLLVQLH